MKLTAACRGIEIVNKPAKKRIEKRRKEILANARRSFEEWKRGELKSSSSISELKRILVE
jgi:hypothetical protein